MTIEKFSARLRNETSRAHSMAESMAFVTGFLKGTINRDAYAALLIRLYQVYSVMEEVLKRHQDEPIAGKIYFPELERQDSLARDLHFFLGEKWEHKLSLSPAVIAYTSRLEEIAESEPYLLVAHSYVRYLGDLSGGQILSRIAKRSLSLDDEGLEFYSFPKIEAPSTFKEHYRQVLDELPLSPEQEVTIISEANHAFKLNMGIFDELEGSSMKAIAGALFPRKKSSSKPQ